MQKKILIIPLLLLAGLFLFGCTNQSLNTLTVNVVDQYGNPLSGANVSIYSNYSLSGSDSLKWMSINGNIQGNQTTTETGTVSFTLPVSKYAINAYKNGYFYDGAEVTLDSSKQITVKLIPIQNYTLQETGNDGVYSVQEQVALSDKRLEISFTPGLKFYKKNFDSNFEYVYFILNNTGGSPENDYKVEFEVYEIKENSITFAQRDNTNNKYTIYDGKIENGTRWFVYTSNGLLTSFGAARSQ